MSSARRYGTGRRCAGCAHFKPPRDDPGGWGECHQEPATPDAAGLLEFASVLATESCDDWAERPPPAPELEAPP